MKLRTAEEFESLRLPQKRILVAMLKAARPLTRNEIVLLADVDRHNLTRYLGSDDEEARSRSDTEYWPCLLSLGLVRCVTSKGKRKSFMLTVRGLRAATYIRRTGQFLKRLKTRRSHDQGSGRAVVS